MHSPPVELVLDVVHLGTRNLIRNTGDPDGDTISECVRAAVRSHPHGEAVFTVALVALGMWFRRHILTP